MTLQVVSQVAGDLAVLVLVIWIGNEDGCCALCVFMCIPAMIKSVSPAIYFYGV